MVPVGGIFTGIEVVLTEYGFTEEVIAVMCRLAHSEAGLPAHRAVSHKINPPKKLLHISKTRQSIRSFFGAGSWVTGRAR
jgi:hypothetical protein